MRRIIAKVKSNRVRRTYLGGARIDAFTGCEPPVGDAPCPEDWMASTVTAFNGTKEIPGEGLGRLEDGRLVRDVIGELPILVKMLDADERLVIQAHPTVPFARERMNSPVGKTECWYFLPGTTPEACVYLGFREGITREAWRDAFARQEGLLDWLHRIPVRAGDFVFVSGGVPHAIGGGCFMLELQEPSDLMVVAERQTPSGRTIPEPKIHGGLGYEGMFDVYDYHGCPAEEIERRYVRRQATGRIVGPELTNLFSLWRLGGGASQDVARGAGVAVVLSGCGTVNGLSVETGDRLVFSQTPVLNLAGSLEVVVCA